MNNYPRDGVQAVARNGVPLPRVPCGHQDEAVEPMAGPNRPHTSLCTDPRPEVNSPYVRHFARRSRHERGAGGAGALSRVSWDTGADRAHTRGRTCRALCVTMGSTYKGITRMTSGFIPFL